MGRVILVTGGSRGIGAAVCRLAAERGFDVCVNYTSDRSAAEAVVEAVEGRGRKAVAVQADVSDAAQVARLFDEAEAALGPVTDLVNSAGLTGHYSTLAEADPATLSKVIDVNVTGSLLCCREAVRRMSTARGGAGGNIVNLSSAAVYIGSPGEFVWYAASKGAIDSLTLGLSKEVAGEGIRVNAVAPGLIETDIHASAGRPERVELFTPHIPMGRSAPPEEVAEPILWLLSDGASYVTGAVVKVTGGR